MKQNTVRRGNTLRTDKGRGRKELPKAVGYKDTQLHIYALVYYYDSLVSTKNLYIDL